MTDIKTLNDNLRKHLIGGKVMLSHGICFKPTNEKAEILNQVRCFNNFTEDNGPYNEHDFGSFDYKGEKIFWKIDYYDKDNRFMSENPADVTKTNRVMTIMFADEY